jgi:thiamine-phosphate pyrophosphorylase
VILCLVTDRRRFASLERGLFEQVQYAADAGVDLVQVRERDLEAAALVDLAEQIVHITRGSRTRVLVNDRVDVALATGADGVHLRHDSVPVAAARALAAPGWVIGRSVHSMEELQSAAGADFVIAGTVFPTASKRPEVGLLGLDGLRTLVSASPAPVLAIGGMALERIGQVAAAGAAGIAAIGFFLQDRLKDVVSDARSRFDSARPASYHKKGPTP